MWFFSRCISIDSLNTCFQQQKSKSSYDFCLCRGASGILAKRYDEDDNEVLPKKRATRETHCQQYVRRRLPKRYSDIVGPLSNKIYLPRTDSLPRDNKTVDSLSQNDCQRPSIKGKSSEGFYVFNSHSKRSSQILSAISKTEKRDHSILARRYCSKNKNLSSTNAVDLLAHRMQAAMSTELMHSLDRNFVFGDKKQSSHYAHMNRSHSLHITKTPPYKWKEKYQNKEPYYHMIPRVKYRSDDEQKSIETNSSVDELTPDYDDDVIIRSIQNNSNNEVGEEPPVDYEDSKSLETNEKHAILQTNHETIMTKSFIVQQTSTTPSSTTCTHERFSIPPTPPPLPISILQPNEATFRCRTIADNITADHKLILKDEVETLLKIPERKSPVPQVESEQHSKKSSNSSTSTTAKPCYIHLSKEILEKATLRKVSHPVSRSYSTYGSMSHLNNHDTELTTTMREKSSTLTEPALDGLTSSAATSIIIDNEYEHRTSSKIYNDYKRRASLITYATNNTLTSTYSHSTVIHPMHTHIGVRSSSSTSSNDKLNDNALANKKMNLCVINQLNEHLSTRFRQQQDLCLTKNTNSTVPANTNNQTNYDQPPGEIRANENQANVYDEPQNVEGTTTTSTIKSPHISLGSIPPPPPPLPIGGFRSVLPQISRPTSSQRTSLLTLPRESNSADLRCSTGTSTTSSKLSDARILRELRTNPLFAKAKQHLEIESQTNNNQLNSSTCYLRLDTCSKGSLSATAQNDSLNNNNNNDDRNVKMFVMRPNHLKAAETNTAKSMNSNSKDTNRINSRALTKSLLETQCRQSELEIIFQKRAQRAEQNLT